MRAARGRLEHGALFLFLFESQGRAGDLGWSPSVHARGLVEARRLFPLISGISFSRQGFGVPWYLRFPYRVSVKPIRIRGVFSFIVFAYLRDKDFGVWFAI